MRTISGRVEFYTVGQYGVVADDARFKFLRIGVSANACTDPRLQVYAVGGSFLEKLCIERGRSYRALRTIDEVLEQLPVVVK